jgi:hypothetical protein
VAVVSGDRFGDPSGAIAAAVEHIYLVFRRYGLRAQIESCPCGCMNKVEPASIRSHSLRALSADDLEDYVRKAMTTWGDEDDYRHFLPRILELGVSSEANSHTFVHLAFSKLAYAGWSSWPEQERAAVESLLATRWNIGLSMEPNRWLSEGPVFDAGDWLEVVELTGGDTAPFIAEWQRRGVAATLGHIVAFLEDNPRLVTEGELSNDRYNGFDQPQYAEEMCTWLTSLMDDPSFQEQLAAWYQQ